MILVFNVLDVTILGIFLLFLNVFYTSIGIFPWY